MNNTLLNLSREGTTSWTRDPNGMLVSQRASGGVHHYYLADSLGSVVGLTDSTGALTRSYKYDTYGGLRSSTGSTPNPFQYTGEYAEAGGGLYKIGARYYAPGLGRWTQLDPLDQAADLRQGNRYGYAGSDPINIIDPNGMLFGIDLDCAISVAGAGAAVVGATALTGGLAIGAAVISAGASGWGMSASC